MNTIDQARYATMSGDEAKRKLLELGYFNKGEKFIGFAVPILRNGRWERACNAEFLYEGEMLGKLLDVYERQAKGAA